MVCVFPYDIYPWSSCFFEIVKNKSWIFQAGKQIFQAKRDIMPKSKQHPPSFHKSLCAKELYPEATHKIKFVETRGSYLYKTGETVYKIKKTSPVYANPALKEAFCEEEFRLGKIFDEELYLEVLPVILQQNEIYGYGGEGKIVEYALKMRELNERYLLSAQLERKKITPTSIGRIAKFLAGVHFNCVAVDRETEAGKPDHFYSLCDEQLYQLKRYLDASISQPLMDMIRHPLEKFATEQRRLFLRRIKKGRIIHCHGAFVPEHIYIKGLEINIFSPQEAQRKLCLLDAACDIASLTVELVRMQENELSDIFIKRYITAAKDRELMKVLPAYQALVSLKKGVEACETAGTEEEHLHFNQIAMEYFNLAVQFSRNIPMD